ncbi:MAG: type II secretion system protein [Candidatus Kaiserbacteria bacterium]|nr:MAG: type II secretion system protein [Candidatus Kaiserbacteria bacterium]
MTKHDRGFTLIEMIIAVALFATVMLIAVGSLLALVGANRKAQALQSVMNNLNIALDGMVRSIRMGSDYHCGLGTYTAPLECPTGDTIFAFEAFGGSAANPTDQWIYKYDPDTKRIYKSEDAGSHLYAITAPSVVIDNMKFYVVGTDRGDTTQPKVVITIKGTAGVPGTKTETTFSMQATAVQRLLDL